MGWLEEIRVAPILHLFWAPILAPILVSTVAHNEKPLVSGAFLFLGREWRCFHRFFLLWFSLGWQWRARRFGLPGAPEHHADGRKCRKTHVLGGHADKSKGRPHSAISLELTLFG